MSDHGRCARCWNCYDGRRWRFSTKCYVFSLSGVEADEYFDVRPWAEAAGEYLMTFINAEKMPRKLKVCFSNSPKNIPHATYRDLGFCGNKRRKILDVYSAGGLGIMPDLG